MNRRPERERKVARWGYALAGLVLLYIVAVIAFIIVR